MNNLTKAAVAGGAAIVLLLGGAGTFALWNDTADITGLAIDAGELTIEATGGAWNETLPERWVPGDTFTYTADLEITVVGDNLKSELSIDEASITGDADLIRDLAWEFTLDGVDAAGFVDNEDNSYTLPVGDGVYTVPATVTVTFDENSGNDTQSLNVDLSNFGFKVQQLR